MSSLVIVECKIVMESDEKKRVRGSNFTLLEKEIVVDLLSKYGNIIESKKTDGISLKEKEKAWSDLANEYNAHLNVTTRSVKQLKYLYDNLKRSAKRDYSTDTLERYKTVGGKFVPVSTETTSKIIALIGDQVELLRNDDDCDAGYHGDIVPVICTGTFSGEILPPAPSAELLQEDGSNAIREEENLDPGRSEPMTPSTSKQRRMDAAHCRRNIADLAQHSALLCEMEREHMFKKFQREQELLDLKIENAKIKQEILKRKLSLQ